VDAQCEKNLGKRNEHLTGKGGKKRQKNKDLSLNAGKSIRLLQDHHKKEKKKLLAEGEGGRVDGGKPKKLKLPKAKKEKQGGQDVKL